MLTWFKTLWDAMADIVGLPQFRHRTDLDEARRNREFWQNRAVALVRQRDDLQITNAGLRESLRKIAEIGSRVA